VLLEGQGLHEYIDTEIARCERQVTKDSRRLDELDRAIQTGQPENGPTDLDDSEIGLPVLAKKTRLQARVTDMSRQLLWCRQVKSSVMPFVPQDRFNTFAWLGQAKQHPIQSNLMLKLMRAGYSPTLARTILEHMPESLAAPQAIQWMMEAIERNLKTEPAGLHEEGEGVGGELDVGGGNACAAGE